MDTEEKISNNQEGVDDSEETEAVELILFQVSECYVYLVSLWVLISIRVNVICGVLVINIVIPILCNYL